VKIKIPKKFVNHLMKLYQDLGLDYDDAKQELGDLINFMNSLPKEIYLYRIIQLDGLNTLDTKKLGIHYSYDKKNLIDSHYIKNFSYSNKKQTVIVTVKVSKKQIDIIETLSNNILYPNEKEITLIDEGHGVTIIDVEEL
jgi:hypothetical protein